MAKKPANKLHFEFYVETVDKNMSPINSTGTGFESIVRDAAEIFAQSRAPVYLRICYAEVGSCIFHEEHYLLINGEGHLVWSELMFREMK